MPTRPTPKRKTPPRRPGHAGITDPRAARRSNRILKARFDAADADGMAALKTGDYKQLGDAIEREKAIFEEQGDR